MTLTAIHGESTTYDALNIYSCYSVLFVLFLYLVTSLMLRKGNVTSFALKKVIVFVSVTPFCLII